MEKAEKIEAIVNSLYDWEETAPLEFWAHIEDTERQYLKNLPEDELEAIYKGID